MNKFIRRSLALTCTFLLVACTDEKSETAASADPAPASVEQSAEVQSEAAVPEAQSAEAPPEGTAAPEMVKTTGELPTDLKATNAMIKELQVSRKLTAALIKQNKESLDAARADSNKELTVSLVAGRKQLVQTSKDLTERFQALRAHAAELKKVRDAARAKTQ